MVSFHSFYAVFLLKIKKTIRQLFLLLLCSSIAIICIIVVDIAVVVCIQNAVIIYLRTLDVVNILKWGEGKTEENRHQICHECALSYQTFSKYVVYSRGTTRIPFLSAATHNPLPTYSNATFAASDWGENVQNAIDFIVCQQSVDRMHIAHCTARLFRNEMRKKNTFPVSI